MPETVAGMLAGVARGIHVHARLEWAPAAAWVGVSCRRDESRRAGTLWVSVIPCVPVRIEWALAQL